MPTVEQGIVAVLVTYGARRTLLLEVLEALVREGTAHAVVVDNGASWDIATELSLRYGDWVDIVPMGRNTGSAPAYAAGMRRAVELHARWIWLLDDDNRPSAGSLSILCRAYADLPAQGAPSLLALAALRPQGQAGVPPSRWAPRHSAFCGFHFLDLPRKLHKRVRRSPGPALPAPSVPVPIEVSPYGGMFFPATLPGIVGLPDSEFVLYCDDYEWSSRITRAGGRILVVPRASVEDLGATWGSAKGDHVRSLLDAESDSLAYYAMRNEAYFFSTRWRRSRLQYLMNACMFHALLWVLSRPRSRRARYALLTRALREGHAGSLGPRREFTL